MLGDMRSLTDKYQDYIVGFFLLILFYSVVSNFFLYNRAQLQNSDIDQLQADLEEIEQTYEDTVNISFVIRGYYYEALANYENVSAIYEELESYMSEVQDDYGKLEIEYGNLEDLYDSLLLDLDSARQEREAVEIELEAIMGLEKVETLEDDRAVVLPIGGSATLEYDLTYAGYVTVSFNASANIVFWVGSSVSEDQYYSRFPFTFPEVASEGVFTIPACSRLILFIMNPYEIGDVDLTLDIVYTY